jgi:predicted esterase
MRLAAALLLWLALAAAPAQAADCPAVTVPGAEMQKSACLDDLTTNGTVLNGHTDPSDWALLTDLEQQKPDAPAPGEQIDGYFPDTSAFNTTNGWVHDAQFVIRLPEDYNGKLIVTGAPGVRKQYAPDPIISDWAVSHGYAYASTDKGNSGQVFFLDGATPGDAVLEWHQRVTQLARAAKQVVQARYGAAPQETYMTGISNGGYLTRWQIEHHPKLFDGGVDWEGTLFTPDGPNLFTYLPAALANYPAAALGDQTAHDAMIKAGFPPGSEILWADHYAEYWDLSQRAYREEFDPDYDGALPGGIPFCQPGVPFCDADYDLAERPAAVHDALRKVSLTGNIRRPLITLHGTLDALLPIATDSDVYDRMIDAAGRGALHRYWVIEDGNHVDGRYDLHPDALRPIWPCWTVAMSALDSWVRLGVAPPRDQFVPNPGGPDVANECTVKSGRRVPGAGPAPAPGQPLVPDGRVAPASITARVTRRRHHRVRVRGRVVLPAGLEPGQACGSGTVAVGRRRTTLKADCTFALRLRSRRAKHLTARFTGNRALEAGTGSARRARAG